PTTSRVLRCTKLIKGEGGRVGDRKRGGGRGMISMALRGETGAEPINTATISGYAIAAPNEEFLIRLRYWLVIGGMITGMACGITTSRMTRPGVSPSARAASIWPWRTDSTPPLTTSAMKPAV